MAMRKDIMTLIEEDKSLLEILIVAITLKTMEIMCKV